MFALIEMSNTELVGFRLYHTEAEARIAFTACVEENHESEWDSADLKTEIPGTLAAAGDDAYSVQLVEREPEANQS